MKRYIRFTFTAAILSLAQPAQAKGGKLSDARLARLLKLPAKTWSFSQLKLPNKDWAVLASIHGSLSGETALKKSTALFLLRKGKVVARVSGKKIVHWLAVAVAQLDGCEQFEGRLGLTKGEPAIRVGLHCGSGEDSYSAQEAVILLRPKKNGFSLVWSGPGSTRYTENGACDSTDTITFFVSRNALRQRTVSQTQWIGEKNPKHPADVAQRKKCKVSKSKAKEKTLWRRKGKLR